MAGQWADWTGGVRSGEDGHKTSLPCCGGGASHVSGLGVVVIAEIYNVIYS